jgi:2-(1,2-epoxy-1,2-dihydrophenyl)acetyl-CoA isomerase
LITSPSPVLSDLQDNVLTLTLNSPKNLNSLTAGMLKGLGAALASAQDDKSVRVVVITGAGTAFCAGQNLAEEGDISAIDVRQHLHEYYEPVLRGIRDLEKPVIASVNGVAAGAGLSLALAADFRVASQSSSFVQAFVRVGLVPDAGSTYFLPRIVGWGRALELMTLGDSVDAPTALRYGMVNRVVADDELAEATQSLALRLARGPRSQALIKRLLRQSADATFEQQLENEANAQTEAVASADFVRGVGAFFAKQKPEFQGD